MDGHMLIGVQDASDTETAQSFADIKTSSSRTLETQPLAEGEAKAPSGGESELVHRVRQQVSPSNTLGPKGHGDRLAEDPWRGSGIEYPLHSVGHDEHGTGTHVVEHNS